MKLQFAVSFGASMLLGPKLGALADRFGRKKFVLLYAVLYAACAFCHHFQDIYVLTAARVLGGASGTLLYTVFDSWMCHEHRRRKFDDALLESTYSLQAFLNSLSAIVAGVVAQFGVDAFPKREVMPNMFVGGPLVPFEIAIGTLGLAFVVASFRWSSDKPVIASEKSDPVPSILQTIRENKSLLLIGSVESLFESSLFLFAFSWAHGMKEATDSVVNYGMIFAVLMAGCMLGSQIFSLLVSRGVQGLSVALPLGMLAHALVAFGPLSPTSRLFAFVLFEVAVGVYFPSMGLMKSSAVPERLRTTLYSINRVPINGIVLSCLTLGFSTVQTFVCTSVALCMAYLSYALLRRWPQKRQKSRSKSPLA
jgi:MFS family permease